MKNRNIYILGLFLFTLIYACKQNDKTPEEKVKEVKTNNATTEKSEKIKATATTTSHKNAWSYEGETSPEHWAEIEANATCDGTHQSPINIIEVDTKKEASGLKEEDIHYKELTTIYSVTNNGHSIQYNFKDDENYVSFKDKNYVLKQFHFHSPSEHTINGIRYPLVIHMVHQSSEKDFVVFAFMVKEGEASKPFSFIESYLPVKEGETKIIEKPYDFNESVAYNASHFYYKGSLTTPPCTETVNWFVFKEPITASLDQVKALSELMPKNNYRNEQPLNDRTVLLSK